MRTIRRAKPEDAQFIHEAHMRSIQEICSKDHSPEEIKAWGNRPFREDRWLNAIKNQMVWVIDNSDTIEGYGHLAIEGNSTECNGHIMGLYFIPEANGQGLGKNIIRLMIDAAKNMKARSINLESTITAHKFYQKMGFRDSGPEGEIDFGGVGVRYIPMSMEI